MKHARQQAIALVGVLVVIGLSSMVAASLLFRLRAAHTASATSLAKEQAWAAAMSGLRRVMAVVSDPARAPVAWMNNPLEFEHQLVYDDGSEQWYFTVYREDTSEGGGISNGVTDEASRLHLHAVAPTNWLALPGMTQPLADVYLDFTDPDAISRESGAEQDDHYSLLPVPYRVPNKPVLWLDDLLLIKGWSAEHLYGEDANRNFRLDSNENDGDTLFPPDNQDGISSRGLSRFLTLRARDSNVDRQNRPRLDLNNPDADLSETLLSQQAIEFIESKRQQGQRIESPVDLLDAEMTIEDENGKQRQVTSGIGQSQLRDLLECCATTAAEWTTGKLNLNTAPPVLLALLPGIDSGLANAIADTRWNLPPEKLRSAAWLLEEELVDPSAFKAILPQITVRSFQFHAQVVGYGLPSGRYRVIEAVIEVAGPRPRIIYLRDLTKQGVPFHPDPRQALADE